MLGPLWPDGGQAFESASVPVPISYSIHHRPFVNSFAIDPYGDMTICVLSHFDKYNVRDGSVLEGWEHFLRGVRAKHAASILGAHPAVGVPGCIRIRQVHEEQVRAVAAQVALDVRDITIPWIAWGKGVRAGEQIASTVRTFDTASTVLWLLGLDEPSDWRGAPVVAAFD